MEVTKRCGATTNVTLITDMPIEFTPHGEYSISVEPNLLVVKASGGWNLENTNKFVQECKTVVQSSFSQQHFGVLVFTDEWLATHDSMDLLSSFAEWLVEQGMRCEAYCGVSAIETEVLIATAQLEKLPGLRRGHFLLESEARAWLSKAGQI